MTFKKLFFTSTYTGCASAYSSGSSTPSLDCATRTRMDLIVGWTFWRMRCSTHHKSLVTVLCCWAITRERPPSWQSWSSSSQLCQDTLQYRAVGSAIRPSSTHVRLSFTSRQLAFGTSSQLSFPMTRSPSEGHGSQTGSSDRTIALSFSQRLVDKLLAPEHCASTAVTHIRKR